MINSEEFEKLPKEEQNFRWALFLLSGGGARNLDQKIIELAKKYFFELKNPLDMKPDGSLPKFKKWMKTQ
jgi:hypothetical protein